MPKKKRKPTRTIHAVDLFCGAGGTSEGLYRAADKLGFKVKLLAINHWPVAIATHSKNHKAANHICETLDSVDPRKVVPRGKLDLLVASPECTHHSIARGGKPMSDQSRASAWHVLRWAEALRIENIIVENVKEFQTWGPLGVNGLPLKSKKGDTYRAFINALEALGYNVEYDVLNSADYGDPTTRKRLFILAKLGKAKPIWPKQTHSKDGGDGLKQWVAAREIIDWSLPSNSIAGRKKPLAENTLRRIAAGLMKFGGDAFFAMMYGTNKARSIDRPAPTVTAGGKKIALCEPYIVNMKGKSKARSIKQPTVTQTTKYHQYLCEPYIMSAGGPVRMPRSVKDPMFTVLCRDSLAVVEPFVLQQQSGGSPRSTKNPLPTVATKGAISLIQPYLVEYYGKSKKNAKKKKGKERIRSVDDPLPTVTAGGNRFAVCEPFFVAHHGEREGQKPRVHSVNKPMPTVTPRGFELVEPHLVCVNHGEDKKSGSPASRARSLKEPLPTVTCKNGWALIEPFITEYYGTGKAKSIKKPLPTQTTKDKFGLCEPFIVPQFSSGKPKSTKDPLGVITTTTRGMGLAQPEIKKGKGKGKKDQGQQYILDIRFRMLQPHELAAAMSFKSDYVFHGNKSEAVKQIGNAVAVSTAAALCEAVLA